MKIYRYGRRLLVQGLKYRDAFWVVGVGWQPLEKGDWEYADETHAQL